MNSSTPFPVKKVFLQALCWSVGLSALLGIIAILSGRFGEFEIKVLLTAVSISAGSVCGLACGAFLAVQRRHPLPWIGIGLALLGVVLVIFGIWTQVNSIEFWKFTASTCVFAVATAHLALLSMARLAEWFRWSLAAAYVTILGVASLIVLMIVGEADGVGIFQLLGVAAIVDAAITVLIPIFHKLSKADLSTMTSDSASGVLAQLDVEIEQVRARLAELESRRQAMAEVH